jgi:hypothetical protein
MKFNKMRAKNPHFSKNLYKLIYLNIFRGGYNSDEKLGNLSSLSLQVTKIPE